MGSLSVFSCNKEGAFALPRGPMLFPCVLRLSFVLDRPIIDFSDIPFCLVLRIPCNSLFREAGFRHVCCPKYADRWI